ncbi:MAG TPA: hypothetical protein DIW41_11845 [Lachnospiraceae bacterium]|nr:hypothetical protein [Lachnospiraceae bacterium]
MYQIPFLRYAVIKNIWAQPPESLWYLHTWGQKLNFHPHIHCALSGGGLTESGQFTESCHKGFLLPVEAMGKTVPW